MNVVFAVPIQPPRFLVYIFRTGLILLMVGSVVFTTLGFIAAKRRIERSHAHGTQAGIDA